MPVMISKTGWFRICIVLVTLVCLIIVSSLGTFNILLRQTQISGNGSWKIYPQYSTDDTSAKGPKLYFNNSSATKGVPARAGGRPTAVDKPRLGTQGSSVKKLSIPPHHVIVWGRSISTIYLWRDILGGPVTKAALHGEVTIDSTTFSLHNGVHQLPKSIEETTEYMVLVLKQDAMGRDWFKKHLDNRFKYLKKLAVVIVGSEQCTNSWLHQFMRQNGGRVDVMFIVYDTPEIDDKTFFQWPLGVSAHRGFPAANISEQSLNRNRKYMCNFMGSLSTSGSRWALKKIIDKNPMKEAIYMRVRNQWIPTEEKQSLQQYINILSDSDLTLCPVGHNTECFRIYEAMAFGSIPVVQDVMTGGKCGKSKISNVFPLRLLKDFKAPLIYVKNWNELPRLLEKERNMTTEQKIDRRKQIVTWYRDFKLRIRDKFMKVLQQTFFESKGS